MLAGCRLAIVHVASSDRVAEISEFQIFILDLVVSGNGGGANED